jgi:hypothetical protein
MASPARYGNCGYDIGGKGKYDFTGALMIELLWIKPMSLVTMRGLRDRIESVPFE